jgi:uncharacterized membrane protein
MSDRIKVKLAPSSLQVNAGGEPIEASITVQNLGDIVDRFSFQLDDLDSAWYTFSESGVSLFPNDKAQVRIKFQVPKKEGIKSGAYPFNLRVSSDSNSEEYSIVQGSLEIGSLAEFHLDMNPKRVETRKSAEYRITLANSGTSDLTFNLKARDTEEGCRFWFTPQNPVVPAWQTVVVKLIGQPKRRPWLGENKPYNFTLAVNVQGKTESKSLNGELIYHPRWRSLRPLWRVLRIILILAAIAGAIYFVLWLGGGLGQLIENPGEWLSQAKETLAGFAAWFHR